jgi:hypothetical protein
MELSAIGLQRLQSFTARDLVYGAIVERACHFHAGLHPFCRFYAVSTQLIQPSCRRTLNINL